MSAGLADHTIAEALCVPACGRSVSRSVIDGAVVIYSTDDPPVWLRAVIRAQDEDGNTTDALTVVGEYPDGTPELIRFDEGTAITGPKAGSGQ